MRIFVLGSNGMLGHVLSRYLKEQSFHVVDITRDALNATNDVDQIDWAVRSWCVRPDDIAINCIGIVPQKLSTIKDEHKVNTIFPHKLAQHFPNRIIHISTNCVFSGTEHRAYTHAGYTEYDFPRPDKSYGVTKLNGEIPLQAMVLRTSVIGPQIKGIYGFYTRARLGSIKEGYVNHYWNGITTLQLSKTIAWIIAQDLYKLGIYHIHSPNTMSKCDLVKEILHINTSHWNITPKLTDGENLTLWSFHQNINLPNIDRTIQDQLRDLHKWY